MGNKLIFAGSAKLKDSVIRSQTKEIRDLYKSWAEDIDERAAYYKMKPTASAPLIAAQAKELSAHLTESSKIVSREISGKITHNIYMVSESVVKENAAWLASLGFPKAGINAAMSSVPDDIVRKLINGDIYDSGWSLSKSIWGDNDKTLKDIYTIVARGVAENKPMYNLAKDLERYVNPSKKLPWNLKMADGKRIYKSSVDYNAQRLGRTLLQHSYQQSFVETTKDNPFVLSYTWIANGSRACPICIDRDGTVYSKDNLPMDHPNGMCVMEPNIEPDITNKLLDWFNSEDGTYPEIDEFASNFGYTPTKKELGEVAKSKGELAGFPPKPAGMSAKDYRRTVLSPEEYNKLFAMHLKSSDFAKLDDFIDDLFKIPEKLDDIVKFAPTAQPKTLKYVDSITRERENDLLKKVRREQVDYLSGSLRKLIDNSDFAMRIPDDDILNKILSDGFKNQLETNTSHGMLNPGKRTDIARELFGIPDGIMDTMIPSDFEKYGYLAARTPVEGYDGASAYGNILIKFKKENVMNRATITAGDSLDNRYYLKPSNVLDPSAISFDKTGQTMRKGFTFSDSALVNPIEFADEARIAYVELQYHGSLTANDIASVNVNPSGRSFVPKDILSDNTIKKLKSLGIEVFNFKTKL